MLALRPLADARILVPIALVSLLVAGLLFDAGARTVEVRILPKPPPAVVEEPRPANDLLIPEFDAPHRRWALVPVAEVEAITGSFVDRSRIKDSFYAWPAQVRRIDQEVISSKGRETFSVIETRDDKGMAVGRIPGRVRADDALLVAEQARVTSELQRWLEGPRATSFVARYGDPWRNLPHALVVLGAGALLVLVFARPRIEVHTTGHPGGLRLRARGLFGTREVDFGALDAEKIVVRSVPKLGLLWNELVFRKPGQPEVPLMPFGTFALQRTVGLRQRLVDAAAKTSAAPSS